MKIETSSAVPALLTNLSQFGSDLAGCSKFSTMSKPMVIAVTSNAVATDIVTIIQAITLKPTSAFIARKRSAFACPLTCTSCSQALSSATYNSLGTSCLASSSLVSIWAEFGHPKRPMTGSSHARVPPVQSKAPRLIAIRNICRSPAFGLPASFADSMVNMEYATSSAPDKRKKLISPFVIRDLCSLRCRINSISDFSGLASRSLYLT
mmetsp:Transcript_43773/g.76831  ORF Transcript_43773/g.76831 Transcript_43773/m.76831 type:complete len:208 (-) Transcript_43773:619-1242(-)